MRFGCSIPADELLDLSAVSIAQLVCMKWTNAFAAVRGGDALFPNDWQGLVIINWRMVNAIRWVVMRTFFSVRVRYRRFLIWKFPHLVSSTPIRASRHLSSSMLPSTVSTWWPSTMKLSCTKSRPISLMLSKWCCGSVVVSWLNTLSLNSEFIEMQVTRHENGTN